MQSCTRKRSITNEVRQNKSLYDMNLWNGIDIGVKVQYNFTRGYSYSQVYNFDDKKTLSY